MNNKQIEITQLSDDVEEREKQLQCVRDLWADCKDAQLRKEVFFEMLLNLNIPRAAILIVKKELGMADDFTIDGM